MCSSFVQSTKQRAASELRQSTSGHAAQEGVQLWYSSIVTDL